MTPAEILAAVDAPNTRITRTLVRAATKITTISVRRSLKTAKMDEEVTTAWHAYANAHNARIAQ